ncbi:DNA polymerase ligase N-terminal domain-containing protein [Jiella pelagia]|uniref:DNA ligase D 3'-phosphoesterase domain-containing protein n=1 Tax=Jiella pelagia TaxID=2986949 RepID=A0ABY7C6B9_9HYPH|nr:DNA polymerase ligase N-terminal domain-containing protein [Jiella pelagia]WAP70791.1 hypothetical protein OH818_12765 [Jiella pelagia]
MASLETYNQKRDFSRTKEPQGQAGRKTGQKEGRGYLIQKHDATRLHYDFRLEHDGVLLSWAVTRGPSYNPSDKRLAVRTEDHPLDYGSFEGTIPKGQYGGGTVMLWDTGAWNPLGDVAEGLERGELKFEPLRRAAAGPLGACPDEAAKEGKARELAAHQGEGRTRPAGRGRRGVSFGRDD